MKIRWTRRSVRFRITPSELAMLERGESVVEVLAVPGGRWSATIHPGAEATNIILEDGQIHFALSEGDRESLSAPEAEGVYFVVEEAGEIVLRYFIEKDFPCVHPGAPEAKETPTETFAPPPGFKERHRTCA